MRVTIQYLNPCRTALTVWATNYLKLVWDTCCGSCGAHVLQSYRGVHPAVVRSYRVVYSFTIVQGRQGSSYLVALEKRQSPLELVPGTSYSE